jgi:hypothetical protein
MKQDCPPNLGRRLSWPDQLFDKWNPTGIQWQPIPCRFLRPSSNREETRDRGTRQNLLDNVETITKKDETANPEEMFVDMGKGMDQGMEREGKCRIVGAIQSGIPKPYQFPAEATSPQQSI